MPQLFCLSLFCDANAPRSLAIHHSVLSWWRSSLHWLWTWFVEIQVSGEAGLCWYRAGSRASSRSWQHKTHQPQTLVKNNNYTIAWFFKSFLLSLKWRVHLVLLCTGQGQIQPGPDSKTYWVASEYPNPHPTRDVRTQQGKLVPAKTDNWFKGSN